ncbi:MAG: NAD(P)/FAD-dependent oxidoreductase [Candidatus Thorarchaeota archaeon]|nr:NAD(P)/FAD-dependent oxidoreductase [Candidatus Thorarchaeota archaeon]
MPYDTDVIVIGAGPAGLIASQTLASSNIAYTLIERSNEPGCDKPCGGFIPASTIKRFEIPAVEGQHEIDTARMKFPRRDLVSIQFEEMLGVNVSRPALGKALLSKIPDQHKTTLLGTTVTKMETSNEMCRVWIQQGEDERVLTAQLIIDASGANPVSQRFVTLRKRIPNTGMGYGLQYHIEMERELGGSNAFLYGNKYSPSGYCWIFPRGRIAIVGTGGLVSRVRENDRRTHEYLDYVLAEVEPFNNELDGGTIIKKDSALMPLCGIIRPSFGKRIMLAGDAAGHCSPISGEGIHYSMAGGYAAAMTAIQCIKGSNFSDDMLSSYEKRWTKDIGSDLKWGLWLQRKLMRPGAGENGGWSSSGFIDSEKSQTTIAEMLMGVRSVRSAILSIAPGYLRSKIGRSWKK